MTPSTPTTGPQIADPLADLPTPTPTGTAYATDPNVGSDTTLYPGIYNAGLTVTAGTATFTPGEYYINGGTLAFKNNATVLGDGVFFYAYNNANLVIANNTTTVTMSAPTSGTYRGIWYFQDRADTKDAVVSGGAVTNISGTIYISNPSSKLTYSGGSSSGSLAQYTIFVVWQFIIGGGGTFHNDFSGLGGSPLPGGVALSE